MTSDRLSAWTACLNYEVIGTESTDNLIEILRSVQTGPTGFNTGNWIFHMLFERCHTKKERDLSYNRWNTSISVPPGPVVSTFRARSVRMNRFIRNTLARGSNFDPTNLFSSRWTENCEPDIILWMTWKSLRTSSARRIPCVRYVGTVIIGYYCDSFNLLLYIHKYCKMLWYCDNCLLWHFCHSPSVSQYQIITVLNFTHHKYLITTHKTKVTFRY